MISVPVHSGSRSAASPHSSGSSKSVPRFLSWKLLHPYPGRRLTTSRYLKVFQLGLGVYASSSVSPSGLIAQQRHPCNSAHNDNMPARKTGISWKSEEEWVLDQLLKEAIEKDSPRSKSMATTWFHYRYSRDPVQRLLRKLQHPRNLFQGSCPGTRCIHIQEGGSQHRDT